MYKQSGISFLSKIIVSPACKYCSEVAMNLFCYVAMVDDEFILQTALEFYLTVISFYSFMYKHHFLDCTFISSKLHSSNIAITVCNMCNI